MENKSDELARELLVDYFSGYAKLTKDQIQIIKDTAISRHYSKGSVLLRAGEFSRESYLVLRGCVRSYFLKEGEEKNTQFFLEKDPIVPVSYIKGEASEYFIECVEDCILSIGKSERTEQILASYPQLIPIYRKISDDFSTNQLISSDKFRSLSPEEHYLELLRERPELFDRIPQYHLASYLGIKPQSLSRIRKRLSRGD